MINIQTKRPNLININYKDAIFMHKLFFYRNDLVVFSLFFPFLGYCIPS